MSVCLNGRPVIQKVVVTVFYRKREEQVVGGTRRLTGEDSTHSAIA